MERKDLIEQIDHFKEEITQLQEQLQDTTKMVLNHKCVSVQVMDAVDHGKGPEGFETDVSMFNNMLQHTALLFIALSFPLNY